MLGLYGKVFALIFFAHTSLLRCSVCTKTSSKYFPIQNSHLVNKPLIHFTGINTVMHIHRTHDLTHSSGRRSRFLWLRGFYFHTCLYELCSLDKISPIIIVFFHASRYCQNIRVKDDIVWIKLCFFDQDIVCSTTNLYFSIQISSLEIKQTTIIQFLLSFKSP